MNIREYKERLDVTLSYYADFLPLINAVKLDSADQFIESLERLKEKMFMIIVNKQLFEQVYFDLDTNEAKIFFNYGFKKIDVIIDTFHKMLLKKEQHFYNDILNKKIHELWHRYSENGEILILYSPYHEGFINLLFKALENNLNQFKADFTEAYLLGKQEILQTKEKETEFRQQTLEIKPVFNSEAVHDIFYFLKNYFPTQNADLKKVLETGIIPEEKLIFNGSGKALLDFFKQLIKGQFLSIAVQKDFEKWIADGFEYLHMGKRKRFTPKYASKIISGSERAAKGNRIIDVINTKGKFEIVQLEIKGRLRN